MAPLPLPCYTIYSYPPVVADITSPVMSNKTTPPNLIAPMQKRKNFIYHAVISAHNPRDSCRSRGRYGRAFNFPRFVTFLKYSITSVSYVLCGKKPAERSLSKKSLSSGPIAIKMFSL